MPAKSLDPRAHDQGDPSKPDIEAGITTTASGAHSRTDALRTIRSEANDHEEGETTNDEIVASSLDWDGPDDGDNPLNWSKTQRYATIVIVAAYTLLVYVLLVQYLVLPDLADKPLFAGT